MGCTHRGRVQSNFDLLYVYGIAFVHNSYGAVPPPIATPPPIAPAVCCYQS